MNYPFATPSPYIQAAMAQALQALMSGGPLPPNCVVMAMPYSQGQQMLPPMMMNGATGPAADPIHYPSPMGYYGQVPLSPYTNNPASRAVVPHSGNNAPNYNYPVVSHKDSHKSKKKTTTHQQPHSNIYNSASFDSYMRHLSWSRLFDHPPRKNSKEQNPGVINQDGNAAQNPRSSSTGSSTSSTTSDETIRRVNVTNQQASNVSSKQQPKGSLPFKYSSEFVPGAAKQPSQKIKSNDIFVVRKP